MSVWTETLKQNADPSILYESMCEIADGSGFGKEPGFDHVVYNILKKMRFKYGGSLQNKLDNLIPWGTFFEPNDKRFTITVEKQQKEQHIVDIYFVKCVEGDYQVCVEYSISNETSQNKTFK